MSFAGSVGIGKEAAGAFGVAVSITDWFLAETATPTVHRPQVPSAAIANDWETLASTPGLWEVGVNITVQAYAATAIQNLINAIIARAPANSSTYDPNQPYSYTFELVMDNGQSVQIVGCRCSQGQFSVKPGDVNKITADFMGKSASVISSSMPSPAVGAQYHGGYTTFSLNGTPNPLPNLFDLTVSNNTSRRYSFTGDGTARNVRAANQVGKGNMGADYETTAIMSSFLSGTDTAIIVTTTAGDNSTMVFQIPIARFEGDDPALNGANAIEDKLPFLAVKNSDAGYALSIAVNADTTAPTVSSTSPANAATGVTASTTVVWTFSEDLRVSSVSTSSVAVIKDSDGTAVAGTVALVNNGASTTVTFTPGANLASGQAYTAVLTTQVRDLAGNPLAATSHVHFTIA